MARDDSCISAPPTGQLVADSIMTRERKTATELWYVRDLAALLIDTLWKSRKNIMTP